MIDLNHSQNLAVRPRAGCFHELFVLPVLMMAGLGLMMLAGQVTAQTFTDLYSFSGGGWPYGGLVLSGKTLYGTARGGGSSGSGTVFAINTDAKGFTNLHSFAAGSGEYPYITNSDGVDPSGLVLSGNVLYATAFTGGISGNGTVFAVNTDGTSFRVLHSFFYNDGSSPSALVISADNTLYGTANYGGSLGRGTVFKVNTDGTGFSTLYSFTALSSSYPYTNSDGASPNGLILSSNTLYGTTTDGGSSGNGTVFALGTNGTGFTNLHNFEVVRAEAGGLIVSGNILYGTVLGYQLGFDSGVNYGSVFRINTDSTGFTNLIGFGEASRARRGIDCSQLILSGNTLYVVVSWVPNEFAGEYATTGEVFAFNTDGTGFSTLYWFPAYSFGEGPVGPAGLILSGNTLYGTENVNRTIFSISFPLQLTITPSGTNLILSWPTNYAGFDYSGYTLQSTTNLGSPVWTTNSPTPVVVNGQLAVTNPISGTQQFFRLSQ